MELGGPGLLCSYTGQEGEASQATMWAQTLPSRGPDGTVARSGNELGGTGMIPDIAKYLGHHKPKEDQRKYGLLEPRS